MQATPNTDCVSPVLAADLAAYLGVPSTDPLLTPLLTAATDAAIRWINRDLTPRTWTAIIPVPDDPWPRLSPYDAPPNRFELPYTGLVSVTSVEADGEAVEYELEPNRRPARITLLDWDRSHEVEIVYVAGMSPIPQAIKEAIKMIAAYGYEHRGSCEADEAIRKSGAVTMLRPYRVEATI